MSDITKEQVVEWIKGLTVLEVSDLVKTLEDELGVSAAAPVAVAAAPANIHGDVSKFLMPKQLMPITENTAEATQPSEPNTRM